MTDEELRKLRTYYHSLAEQRQIFNDAMTKHNVARECTVRVLADELRRIEADFPRMLPEFNANNYLSGLRGIYNADGICSYLAVALARLKAAVDVPEDTPVTQTREFAFVKNPDLRRILERDYVEVQRVYVANAWKSVIVLAGGAIEAMLLDVLLAHEPRAKAASSAPKKPSIADWDLNDLINVAVELGLVTSGVEKLSHSVRQYRNLVHPSNEIKHKLSFEAEEAKIALEFLHMVHRDLSKP